MFVSGISSKCWRSMMWVLQAHSQPLQVRARLALRFLFPPVYVKRPNPPETVTHQKKPGPAVELSDVSEICNLSNEINKMTL